MNKTRTELTVAAALVAAIFCSPGWAQTKTTAPDPAKPTLEKEREVIELSPFVVDSRNDTGYRATNAISGTRLNTSIKDLPLSLEVITNEFLTDTGATNLREALRYSPGVVIQSQYDGISGTLINVDTPDSSQANNPQGATRSSNSSTIKIRGFVTDQSLRDGFRRQDATDAINIERVEVVRGPSALLYGIGSFGGIVNYLTKRPTEKSEQYVSASVGSNGLLRAEFDSSPGTIYRNGEATVGFRLTGAWQERGDFTQYYDESHWFVSPVIEIKPWRNTTILIDTEFGSSREEGIGFQSVRSNVLTDGYPYSTNARRNDFYTPPGTDRRTYRWAGPDSYLEKDLQSYLVDVQHKFTDNIWLKVGAQRSERTQESLNNWFAQFSSLSPGIVRNANGTIANVTAPRVATLARYYYAPRNATESAYLTNLANAVAAGGTGWVSVFDARPANFWYGDVYGRPFTSTSLLDSSGADTTSQNTVLNYTWSKYRTEDTRDQFRAELAVNFNALWGKHNFLLGTQYQKLDSRTFNQGQTPDQTDNSAPVNSDPLLFNFKSPTDTTPIRYATQGDGTTPSVALRPIRRERNLTWDLGDYLIYQGRFWNDRITLIGGLRWDRNDARQYYQRLWLPNEGEQINDRTHPAPGVPPVEEAPNHVSKQAGVSVAITRNISLFGVYSTGLLPTPAGTLDGNGQQFGPVTAVNHEAGLKFELLDGKISGSIAAYKIKRDNISRSIWWAPAPGVPAALSGHLANYDKNKPTTVGFYSWGALNPYVAWYASRGDLTASTPWAKIYPAMASVLVQVPKDPTRKWGGYALPLGAPDIYATPSTTAVDANGNSLGITLAQLWTQTVGAGNLPAMPVNAAGTSSEMAFNASATDPWTAAWVPTAGIMVSDKTKGEVAAQQLYDMMWAMNVSTMKASASNPNAQVFGWGGALPWLWAGAGETRPYYPGYWNNANAAADANHNGIMNSILGMNSTRLPFSDESQGVEASLMFTPTPNLQIVLGYSHNENKNTTASLQYVALNDPTGNAAYGLWSAAGGNFGTTYFSREEAFEDPNNPATYKIPPNDYGLRLDDTPEDTVTVWSKYTFTSGKAKGLGIGLGGSWSSGRLFDASVSVDGTVSGTLDPKTFQVLADQLYTQSRVEVNMLLEYNTVIQGRYRTRFALNIDNLLDDKDRYGYIYAPGRTLRFSTSVRF